MKLGDDKDNKHTCIHTCMKTMLPGFASQGQLHQRLFILSIPAPSSKVSLLIETRPAGLTATLKEKHYIFHACENGFHLHTSCGSTCMTMFNNCNMNFCECWNRADMSQLHFLQNTCSIWALFFCVRLHVFAPVSHFFAPVLHGPSGAKSSPQLSQWSAVRLL